MLELVEETTRIFDTTKPVVTAVCEEKRGRVVRNIYPMQLSKENLDKFWEKQSQFRALFVDEINGDFKKFAELFISEDGNTLHANGLFWVVDDFVGIFYMTHITDIDAQAHYTFFDRNHFGREELTKKMIKFVFDKYKFQRLNVEIPMYASKKTFDFTQSLGFVREGRRRAAAHYKGEWFDIACFGILNTEVTGNGRNI